MFYFLCSSWRYKHINIPFHLSQLGPHPPPFLCRDGFSKMHNTKLLIGLHHCFRFTGFVIVLFKPISFVQATCRCHNTARGQYQFGETMFGRKFFHHTDQQTPKTSPSDRWTDGHSSKFTRPASEWFTTNTAHNVVGRGVQIDHHPKSTTTLEIDLVDVG